MDASVSVKAAETAELDDDHSSSAPPRETLASPRGEQQSEEGRAGLSRLVRSSRKPDVVGDFRFDEIGTARPTAEPYYATCGTSGYTKPSRSSIRILPLDRGLGKAKQGREPGAGARSSRLSLPRRLRLRSA
jgi:hypothetical protein